MSSATSIDGAPRRLSESEPRDSFKPWHFFVLASLVAATAAVILARQSRPEHLVLISLTIGGAGFAAGALYRTLTPFARRDTVAAAEPLSEGMRAVLEREKLLALRAIKELEFDRAMGKVAPKDFEEMAGRLRVRAVAIMKQLDAEGAYRELIERELSARLRTPSRGGGGKRRSVPAEIALSPKPPAVPHTCTCGAQNDPDAAFCKRCGTKLVAVSES